MHCEAKGEALIQGRPYTSRSTRGQFQVARLGTSNSYPTSTSKHRRSIACLPSCPSRPRFEPRPTSRRQGSRCQTEGVKPGAPNVIIAQARFRSDRALTPKFGGRPVGNWLKVTESVACTEPPPYARLFLGLLFCQSYQSLSVVYKAHVSR